MDLGLKDNFAFVSGSTAGIGFAIATAFAGEGARVVVNGRTIDRVSGWLQFWSINIPLHSRPHAAGAAVPDD
jgi:NADP-dependent 3-hydroxy acid dehydrogenase YdfG